MTQSHRIDTLVIPDLLFATGKADLQNTGLLDTLYQQTVGNFIDSIVVEGHTDNTGTVQMNQKLANDRAYTVVEYLKRKLPDVFYITRGWGDLKPVADNRNTEGRRKNRRVEVYLYVRD
jgi:outer membrane protein OmpA-like peptidoglycan-associated protein